MYSFGETDYEYPKPTQNPVLSNIFLQVIDAVEPLIRIESRSLRLSWREA
jgi:hypothetical protein